MISAERYQHLGELLYDAVVQFKSETALIEAKRRCEILRMSYREVKHAADRFALSLEQAGVVPGDRVAILMSNQSKWLLSATAVYFRGAVIVPIDYKLEPKEQHALLEHCQPKVLIIEWPFYDKNDLKTAEIETVYVSEAPAHAELKGAQRWEDTQLLEGTPRYESRTREDLASIVYSSGTGGAPKGCMLTHGNYLAQYSMLVELYPLEIGERYLSILPTNHAIDFMCGFLVPFACGAIVVHQRTLRPEFINDALERFKITHIAVVPLILEAFEKRIRERLEEKPEWVQQGFELLSLANAALTRDKPRHGLSKRLLRPVHDAFGGHLRFIFCGGAFVDRDRAQFFYDLGIPVIIGYGLSEAGTVLTVNDLKPFRADSVGKALNGVEIEVRDRDSTTGVGEVWAKTPTLMKGYLNEPELSAETIVDGWLRTGDLGWLDASGHLHLVGRSKNMVVTAGGKNVYPEDVEGTFRELPVEEFVVFASNYIWAQEDITQSKLLAVARGGETEEVREALKRGNSKLPDFKRIQGFVMREDPFPRTASMKIKRPLLAQELREEIVQESVNSL